MSTKAIIGDLSLTLSDGETLTAGSDVALARKWAERVHGAAWSTLSFGEQTEQVSAALAELRRGYGVGGTGEEE